MIIGYQGIETCYSECLLNKFKDDYKINILKKKSFKDFKSIFKNLNEDKINFGLIPIENRIGGSLHCNYDFLSKYNFSIVIDFYYPINHCLLGLKNSIKEDLKNCYSHYQALAQCSNYIKENNLNPVKYFDTAGSAEFLLESQNINNCIIANEMVAKKYKLKIIDRNIQDIKKNYTRFVLISKNKKFPINLGRKSTVSSIVFSLKDKIGSLSNILKIFEKNKINLTKIESRPNNLKNEIEKNYNFKYLFYIDYQGDSKIINKLLKNETKYFKILGNYPTIKYLDDKIKNLTIGIIGYGRFGRFLSEKFVKYANVCAWSRTNYINEANKLGVKFYNDINKLIEFVDVIVISVSINSFSDILKVINFDKIKNRKLIVDVLSVKSYAKNSMIKYIENHDILCTHPMFGPDSGKNGWENLPFLYEKVNINNEKLFEKFLFIFINEGCKIYNINCEEHDNFLLRNQFITHFVGRLLNELKLSDEKYNDISTEGFKSLLKLINNTCNDSFDLFKGLYKYNKNGKIILEQFLNCYNNLLNKLNYNELISLNVKKVSFSKTSLNAKKVTNFESKLNSEGNDNILLKLHIGEFSDLSDNYIKNIAKNVIENKGNQILYTGVGGMNELKELIIKKENERMNSEYKLSNVVCSNGAKQSIYQILKLLCNLNDEVIITSPYWTSYPEMVKLIGAIPKIVHGYKENNYFPEIEELQKKITKKTKAIIICNPCNPTGTILNKNNMDNIVKLIQKNNLFLISDEIYGELDYYEKFISFGNYKEIYNKLFIVNGFSKALCMTGYRLGYTICPLKYSNELIKIQSHITGSPNTIVQYIGIEVLKNKLKTGEYIKRIKNKLKKNAIYLKENLSKFKNISFINTDGGFYMFIDIYKLIGKRFNNFVLLNTEFICNILLNKYFIAITPGEGFGMKYNVRVSLCCSFEKIKLFCIRFINFLKNIK